MAKKIELAPDQVIAFGKTATATKYPLDQWFNGDPWLLTRGEDWDAKVDVPEMIAKIRNSAKRKDKVLEIARTMPAVNGQEGAKIENGFILRARAMMADELVVNAKWKKDLAAKVKADVLKRKAKEKAAAEAAKAPAAPVAAPTTPATQQPAPAKAPTGKKQTAKV